MNKYTTHTTKSKRQLQGNMVVLIIKITIFKQHRRDEYNDNIFNIYIRGICGELKISLV